jgi:hypothetical protein
MRPSFSPNPLKLFQESTSGNQQGLWKLWGQEQQEEVVWWIKNEEEVRVKA